MSGINGGSLAVPVTADEYKRLSALKKEGSARNTEVGSAGFGERPVILLAAAQPVASAPSPQSAPDTSEQKKIKGLIDVFKSRNYVWIQEAVEALQKIGSPAIPAIVEALKDNEWIVRYHAAYTLGEFGDKQAVPDLVKALNDSESLVRLSAQQAIEKIKKAQTQPVAKPGTIPLEKPAGVKK
ncbi:MAG: HEAT repeat domain-containing protein [Candidatus Saganbacteria bacterium]|nr:HEAT repeat domain-containing protein [Candidatus Saganbacteria bacterium]